MSFTVLIPARLASSRLPGKVLLPIAGLPMIERVRRAALASGAARVVVAADDAEILATVRAHGGEAVQTDARHSCGSERLAEAVEILGLGEEEIVVNLQGDEPQMPASLLQSVAAALAADPQLSVATAAVPLRNWADLCDPHAVKVVLDAAGHALYFSRAPIPWDRDRYPLAADAVLAPGRHWRHLGLYAYRAGFLRDYARWPRSPLEELESLEQLRILERGLPIRVCCAEIEAPIGVDTPGDLARVRAIFSHHEECSA
ncbi:3-deoxy-manno-octulosonate cytidylyltransferase [Candidatus Igneacidithiobacillus taiwanensis]|uniref:3-deoxy-manno-octulosonate cytidylyltransferase n=1 Tax=Candidatus Igneacidithiobacillus taiwanensis TaxID=1945924 RepID=UPI0028A1D92E|nr:3-deoxy-manno-octulosonate cytidylyltransferase [Candidatus Igneacidithiobacillus taiwanensis]MCE5361060.1 3-deoxy-manno-octulosonate cytidylyltransferase [Acidithiobacillus sp.]